MKTNRMGRLSEIFQLLTRKAKNLNYTLSEGDSSLFSLSSDGTLKAKRTFDFETDPIAHTIKVKASDPEGLYHEKSFGIEILNANEPPAIIRYWDRTFGGSGVETLNDGTKTSDGGSLVLPIPASIGKSQRVTEEEKTSGWSKSIRQVITCGIKPMVAVEMTLASELPPPRTGTCFYLDHLILLMMAIRLKIPVAGRICGL